VFARHRQALPTPGYLVFLLGLAVMLEHLTEDAFVHEENGESLAAKLGATGFALLLVGVGAALYPLVSPRVRPFFVLLFGVIALPACYRAHVTDVLDGDAAGGDYTGTLYALAGLMLIGLAVWLGIDAFRGRSAYDRTTELR
jgi:hypothetical protein